MRRSLYWWAYQIAAAISVFGALTTLLLFVL